MININLSKLTSNDVYNRLKIVVCVRPVSESSDILVYEDSPYVRFCCVIRVLIGSGRLSSNN